MKKILALILCSSFGAANASILLSETFDPINAGSWHDIDGGTVTGAGNSEFLDGNALWFSGDSGRRAISDGYDLSYGGSVSFNLKLGGSNDTALFENIDADEDIVFSYSTNNGTDWIELFVFDSEDSSFTDTWGLISFDITGSAASSDTMFEWRQRPYSNSHDGETFDHWAIDNVTISAVPLPAAIWLFGSGLIGFVWASRKKKNASSVSTLSA